MLIISDYGINKDSKRGIFFYGEKIFTFEHTEDYEVRSYQFCLFLNY